MARDTPTTNDSDNNQDLSDIRSSTSANILMDLVDSLGFLEIQLLSIIKEFHRASIGNSSHFQGQYGTMTYLESSQCSLNFFLLKRVAPLLKKIVNEQASPRLTEYLNQLENKKKEESNLDYSTRVMLFWIICITKSIDILSTAALYPIACACWLSSILFSDRKTLETHRPSYASLLYKPLTAQWHHIKADYARLSKAKKNYGTKEYAFAFSSMLTATASSALSSAATYAFVAAIPSFTIPAIHIAGKTLAPALTIGISVPLPHLLVSIGVLGLIPGVNIAAATLIGLTLLACAAAGIVYLMNKGMARGHDKRETASRLNGSEHEELGTSGQHSPADDHSQDRDTLLSRASEAGQAAQGDQDRHSLDNCSTGSGATTGEAESSSDENTSSGDESGENGFRAGLFNNKLKQQEADQKKMSEQTNNPIQATVTKL